MTNNDFNSWWDSDELTQTNLYEDDAPIWWAWEGWQAAQSRCLSLFTKQLAIEKERADYAWRNTRIIEAARQEEMQKRDAATSVERERCLDKLNLTRSEVSLMAGELSASEWRTIAAVLKGLQARIRNNE